MLRHETHEISLGDLAQRGGQEQRLSLQIGQLPNQLAERVEPQLTSLQLDLNDETQLRLDGDYYNGLSDSEQGRFTINLLDGVNPIGTEQLRKARLDHERRKADVRRDFNGGMLKYMTTPKVPSPKAGLAPRVSTTPALTVPNPTVAIYPTPNFTFPSATPKPTIPSDNTITPSDNTITIAPSTLSTAISSTDVTTISSIDVPDIGTDEWKALSDEQRHQTLRSLLETVSLNSMKLSGVPQMVRNFFRKIAPLDRLPADRGYTWKGERYAGLKLKNAFADLLTKIYHPVLCRVIEYMDEKECTIWDAAAAIEEVRISSGTFEALLKTDGVKRFVGKDATGLRTSYLKRLQSDEFAAAAFEPKVEPIQVISDPRNLTTLMISQPS